MFPEHREESIPPTVHGAIERRPASEYWLQNPAWIDGAIEPPQFYTTHEEINATLISYGRPPRPVPLQAIRDALASFSDNSPLAVSIPENASEVSTSNTDLYHDSHLVTIVIAYSVLAPSTARNAKPISKKTRVNKAKNILMDGISRVDFIKACLGVHDMSEKYSPGIHSGPDFVIWWAGVAGGKSGAPTISTNGDFNTIVAGLLAKDQKKKSLTHFSVEFDLDMMEGFRIKQPASWDEGHTPTGDEELAYGTRVPHIGTFSVASQIHGNFILMLKEKWKCEKHLGEHGEPGFCYVMPDKGHLPLNLLRFKTWASALAAGTCTKLEPPNAPEFDGAHNGSTSIARPRGRTGPNPAASASSATVAPDMSVLLSVAAVALLQDLTDRKRRCRYSSSSPPSTPIHAETPPSRAHSPIPAVHLELAVCLNDFKKSRDIDLTMHEAALTHLELTPAIIPQVPVSRLCQIMDVPEGRVHKFHLFCREWQTHLDEKSQSHKKSRFL